MLKDIKETIRVLCTNAVRESSEALTEEEIKIILIELVESFVDEIDLGYTNGYPAINEKAIKSS